MVLQSKVRLVDLKVRIHDWDPILADLAPELDQALARKGRHVPCPVHGGRDGFRLFKDSSGGGVCNSCGVFTDGFALLQWLRGWRFPKVLEAVAQWLGDTVAIDRSRTVLLKPVGIAAGNRRRREQLQTAWDGSLPLNDPGAWPAHRYLARRRLETAQYPTVLRLHPNFSYFDDNQIQIGRFPVLLSQVKDAAGRPVTLQRIYLTADGHKAPVTAPKKLMPFPTYRRLSGGAIRLDPVDAGILGVTEGLETALAVRQATGMPVWSAISATLLERIVIPVGIQPVVIWADRDQSGRGQEAAAVLAARLKQDGRWVIICTPCGPMLAGQKSLDWLDIVVHEGPAALQLAWQQCSS